MSIADQYKTLVDISSSILLQHLSIGVRESAIVLTIDVCIIIVSKNVKEHRDMMMCHHMQIVKSSSRKT